MKTEVTNFVKSLGGSTKYSGKTKTMYISSTAIEESVIGKFGYSLPFALSTNVRHNEDSI